MNTKEKLMKCRESLRKFFRHDIFGAVTATKVWRESQHYHRLGITTSPSPPITPVLHLRDEETTLFLYALKHTVAIYNDNTIFVKQAKELFRYLCEERGVSRMSDAEAGRELRSA
ncbi:hypothetical protein RR48_15474 [Papilio machaon]|uniref:Uncharacterized protein n=1 Tax=Papilio machaon TaxID=76193 RepID=A0A194QUX5_PAPMA|nr:hypothetical protein RR48_15474 [Papilio machaon]